MANTLITAGAQWLVVLLAMAGLAMTGRARIHLGWTIITILFFAVSVAAMKWLGPLLPQTDVFGPLTWNWRGKIAAIAATLALLAGLRVLGGRAPAESGFTLAQTPGSLRPAAIVTVLLIALSVATQLAFGDGPDTQTERLWYQATLPGLDEELFWRGVFLLAMDQAVRGGRLRLAGAEIGWGGALMTLLFGLAHAMVWQDGALSVSWMALGLTSLFAFGLLWLRARTGSVLVPIIAHNLINVTHSFF